MRITENEIEEVLKFSNEYVSLHSQIGKIESEIRELENKASNLIARLEECRDEEKTFMDALSKKYGEGKINLSTLNWETKNDIYENC